MVLVIDDDPDLTGLLGSWLKADGCRVRVSESAARAVEAARACRPDLILLDLSLPDGDGLSLLPHLLAALPRTPVVVLTGDRRTETVVAAMREGAADYLTKPIRRGQLTATVRNSAESAHLAVPPTVAPGSPNAGEAFGIWGQSDAVQEMCRQIERVAPTDVTVYVHGETGTGKELTARALHLGSRRSDGPFVALNCASIPEQLQESELYGHERGAFTGAHQRHEGRLEQAHGGTLFLDEVAELSLPLQAKLLRALQEQRFHRVGGKREVESDFRLVVATHRDLAHEVREGRFREDLYFRMAVFELHVPPLRERRGDVGLLSERMLGELAKTHGRAARLSNEALVMLERYRFPGNIRELENVLQRALVLCQGGEIRPQDFPPSVVRAMGGDSASTPAVAEVVTPQAQIGAEPEPVQSAAEGAGATMESIERDAIVKAIERASGNLSEVTRKLGIGRTTLYRKLKKYGLR